MSNIGKGKKGSAIELAAVQHLGKHTEALELALNPEDATIKEATRRLHISKGPSVRRVFRRNKRRLSSLDLRVAKETGKPLYSPGKRVKLLQKKIQKYVTQARHLTAILINAAPLYNIDRPRPSFFQAAPKLDRYHQRIAEVGTSISKSNANTREAYAHI